MEDILLAYDWVRLTEQVSEQLGLAKAKLSEAGKFKKEQGWLNEAQALLSKDAEERQSVLPRALALPELAAVQREQAAELVAPWADALEHFHAGIVFHAGLRSPLIEALFPHRKFDALRRADLAAAEAYGEDFNKRLHGAYVERLLAHEDFAFAQPSVVEVEARYAAIAPGGGPTLAPEEAEAVTAALQQLAGAAELAIKQARLLAEAALCPVPNAFAELGIRGRPKTRAAARAKKEEAVELSPAPAPAPPVAKVAAEAAKPRKKKKSTAPTEVSP